MLIDCAKPIPKVVVDASNDKINSPLKETHAPYWPGTPSHVFAFSRFSLRKSIGNENFMLLKAVVLSEETASVIVNFAVLAP